MTTKPSIIFDLDETLIHSFQSKQPNSFQIKVKNRKDDIYNEQILYIRVRKGTSTLIDWLSTKYNIFIFTSASKEYADQIIDHIAPFIPEENRFYRDSIKYIKQTQNNNYGRNCSHNNNKVIRKRGFKDLSIIKNRFNFIELSRTLLIDNSKQSGIRNPSNTVIIKAWNGNDDNDNILMDVLYPALFEIADEDNLPNSLRRHMLLNPGRSHGISLISSRLLC